MVPYPKIEKLIEIMEKVTQNVVSFDATNLAEKAGDPIATNIVMFGALVESKLLPFNKEIAKTTLKESLHPRFYELNKKAFELGRKAYKEHSKH